MFLKQNDFNLRLHLKYVFIFILLFLLKNASKKKILGWHARSTIDQQIC